MRLVDDEMGILEATEILGPIRAYFHKGGTLHQEEALGWCLDCKPVTLKEMVRAAEQELIRREG